MPEFSHTIAGKPECHAAETDYDAAEAETDGAVALFLLLYKYV